MFSIQLNNLGKKFNREWIFRNLSYQVNAGQKLLVSGGNGSGKSTFLQVLSGFVTPNEGDIIYSIENKIIAPDQIKNHISFASPYLQLVEDLTLEELINHIMVYKPFVNTSTCREVMTLLELSAAKDKYVKQFSSGMKQRLKLGLAILANTPLVMLDEPVSNLDKNAIAWYRQLLTGHALNRTIIVCSNAISDEHFFCDSELNVTDFKPALKDKRS